METKTCTKCLETQLMENFSVRDKKTGRLNSWCRSCRKKYQAIAWKTKSTEMKSYKAEWYLKNKENQKAKCRQRYHEGDKQQHSHKVWRNKIRREFGITEDEYNKMLKSQNGVCKICKLSDEKRLAVDHCHNTGIVRGLLCQKCNTALGLFQENSELLKEAVNYLLATKQVFTTALQPDETEQIHLTG